MTRPTLRRLVLAAVLAALPGGAMANGDGVEGHWLTENERAIFRLEPCGEALCGRLAWIRNPFDDMGGPKRDSMNPDPDKRDRALCGATILTGLDQQGPGIWTDGRIYNSEDGSTYGFDVELSRPDVLAVRGYFGISLFGRTQRWTRVDSDRGGCPNYFRRRNDR